MSSNSAAAVSPKFAKRYRLHGECLCTLHVVHAGNGRNVQRAGLCASAVEHYGRGGVTRFCRGGNE